MIKVNRPAAPVLQCEQGGGTANIAKNVAKGGKAVKATVTRKRK